MVRALGCEGGIYDAHNGVLLMLIEFGLVGTLIYTAMLVMFSVVTTACAFSPHRLSV